MAGLDPRDPPNENRVVTIGYLNELYAKAERLRKLEDALEPLRQLLLLDPWYFAWNELEGSEIEAICEAIVGGL